MDTRDYAQSVAVAGSVAYVADGEAGLQVINISIPAAPVITGSVNTVAVLQPDLAPSLTTLGAVFPNPSRDRHGIEVRVGYAQPPAALRVIDVTGRLVRRLNLSALSPGAHRVTWDGRGRDGRPSPAAVYFIEVETPAGPVSRRIVRTQ